MPTPPDLLQLAHEAHAAGAAIIVDESARRPITLPPAAPGASGIVEPLLGMRCGSAVVAVAYPVEVIVHRHDDRIVEAQIGVAVDRSGNVAIADDGSPLETLESGNCSTDLGLRALGLATPPPDQPVEAFVDGIWLDQVLQLALDADLGKPPRWRSISLLHPLGHGRVHSPEELRRLRADLPGGWESLRRALVASGRRDALMPAPLADWCDTGAFARRLLATTVSAADVIDDLAEILRPRDAALVRMALQPELRVA
jgi:hypothetical protein